MVRTTLFWPAADSPRPSCAKDLLRKTLVAQRSRRSITRHLQCFDYTKIDILLAKNVDFLFRKIHSHRQREDLPARDAEKFHKNSIFVANTTEMFYLLRYNLPIRKMKIDRLTEGIKNGKKNVLFSV